MKGEEPYIYTVHMWRPRYLRCFYSISLQDVTPAEEQDQANQDRMESIEKKMLDCDE